MDIIVTAVEERRVAKFVGQRDLGKIEPAAGGDRKPRRHVECIGGVKPGVERRRAQTDRSDIARRLVDEQAVALHERKLIGIDCAEFARRGELHQPAVETKADHEIVVVTKYFLR